MADLNALTTACIRCGFCLEACPTFTQTASEMESPRGRIYLVRSADEGVLRWQEDVRPHLDRCLGCLACQTACPSGVQYGAILELARERLEEERPDRPKRMLLESTTRPDLLRLQLTASRLLPGKRVPGFLSRWVSGEAPEADLPRPQPEPSWPPLDEEDLPPIRGEVYLLEGCAMRVLFPRVREATRRLLRRVGFLVRDVPQGCCGALHAHAGLLEEASKRTDDLTRAFAEDLPVIVDSAGCGSHLKHAWGKRTYDISEFLLAEGLVDALRIAPGLSHRATYHDACHLAHGQGIREEPRRLLEAVPDLVALPLRESDVCCGSAGIYNVEQPAMARGLLERKWRNVEATGAEIVVLGNPGCHAWIAQAAREHGGKVLVMHTTELLESAFWGSLDGVRG